LIPFYNESKPSYVRSLDRETPGAHGSAPGRTRSIDAGGAQLRRGLRCSPRKTGAGSRLLLDALDMPAWAAPGPTRAAACCAQGLRDRGLIEAKILPLAAAQAWPGPAARMAITCDGTAGAAAQPCTVGADRRAALQSRRAALNGVAAQTAASAGSCGPCLCWSSHRSGQTQPTRPPASSAAWLDRFGVSPGGGPAARFRAAPPELERQRGLLLTVRPSPIAEANWSRRHFSSSSFEDLRRAHLDDSSERARRMK